MPRLGTQTYVPSLSLSLVHRYAHAWLHNPKSSTKAIPLVLRDASHSSFCCCIFFSSHSITKKTSFLSLELIFLVKLRPLTQSNGFRQAAQFMGIGFRGRENKKKNKEKHEQEEDNWLTRCLHTFRGNLKVDGQPVGRIRHVTKFNLFVQHFSLAGG